MEQSILDRNLEDVSGDLEIAPALRIPSYHPTRWLRINQVLDMVDNFTGGRAGLCQKFFSFAFIGGCAALVNLAVFWFVLSIPLPINFALHDTIAFLFACELSIVANFIPNDYFTFRHAPGRERSWGTRCVRFHITCIGGTVLTFLIQFGLIHLVYVSPQLGVSPLLAQAIALIIVLFYNFSFHHFFTYREIKTITQ